MHIWLVNPYGVLPGEAWREYRTVLAGRALVAAGHTVTWWVASFEHRSKHSRATTWAKQMVFPGFEAIIVPTSGYQKHISFGRIRFEKTYAANIRREPNRAPSPDVIVLGEPALFTARPICAFARERGIPLVLDIGDLWPELFHIALPRPIRWMGRLLFDPLYRRRAALVRQSSGYIAVSSDYLALLQKIVPRVHGAVCYWGVDIAQVRKEMCTAATLPNELLGRSKSEGDIWAIYAGTLGPNYDIETILKAAAILKERRARVTILIAGDGMSSSDVREAIEFRKLDNCVFLGSLPAATVAALYPRCDLALCTYVGGSTVSMPIKAYDYFAAGLPIVNSLGRDLEKFVRTRRVGLQYEPQNAESLADAITQLATNPVLRTECAANAKVLGDEFDWRIQYQDYVHVVEAVGRAQRNIAT